MEKQKSELLDEVNSILVEQLRALSKMKCTDKNFDKERQKARATAELGNAIIHSTETALKKDMWDSGFIVDRFGKAMSAQQAITTTAPSYSVENVPQLTYDVDINGYEMYDYCDSDDPAEIAEWNEEQDIKVIESKKRK